MALEYSDELPALGAFRIRHSAFDIPPDAGRPDDRGRREAGMALVSVLLVMMLMSALLVGFFAMIAADQQSSGVNRDQTQAYAAAHAGLEKLTADLGALFTGGNYSPTTAQLDALTTAPPPQPRVHVLAPSPS
jgi:type II secretory pathway pseudopilin PulG